MLPCKDHRIAFSNDCPELLSHVLVIHRFTKCSKCGFIVTNDVQNKVLQEYAEKNR